MFYQYIKKRVENRYWVKVRGELRSKMSVGAFNFPKGSAKGIPLGPLGERPYKKVLFDSVTAW